MALIAGGEVSIYVNGSAVIGGIHVLRHKDELVVDGARAYFSAESTPVVEVYQHDGSRRRPRCPICRGEIQDGQSIVRCPGCSRISHQIAATADAALDAPTRTIKIETEDGLEVVGRCDQGMAPGTSVSFSVRPEDIQVFPRDRDWSGDNKFDGRIVEKLFLGETTELEVAVDESDPITSRIQSRIDQEFNFKEDDLVSIGWNAEDCNLLSN